MRVQHYVRLSIHFRCLLSTRTITTDNERVAYTSHKRFPSRYSHCCWQCFVPYSGKLSREKTYTNFAIFQPSAKVFSKKFWACHTHYATSFNILRKFSPQSAPFPLYSNFWINMLRAEFRRKLNDHKI